MLEVTEVSQVTGRQSAMHFHSIMLKVTKVPKLLVGISYVTVIVFKCCAQKFPCSHAIEKSVLAIYIVSVYSIINLRRASGWQGIWRCKQNLLDIRYSLVYCCKMVNSCCAYGCRNRMDKRKKRGFFRFPSKRKEKARREMWIRALKRKDWVPTAHSRICGDRAGLSTFEALGKSNLSGPYT